MVLALVAGWTVAFVALGRGEDNAASVDRLTGTNADLQRQLSGVTAERDKLLADRSAAEAAVKSHEDAVKKREDDLAGRETAVKKREDAVTQQEKVQAQNSITEGSWAVGVDVQPGAYRTKEAVTGELLGDRL